MKVWLVRGGIALAILILLAFYAWLFRPWAEYSPARIVWERETGDRVELYRKMDEVFPHQTIEGAGEPAIYTRRPNPIGETYAWDGQDKTLDQYAEEANATAFLVVKNGDIVFERYYRGETADSLHTSWSVAKSYIATLVGMALMDGKIRSLDDTVEMYAPQFQGTDYGQTRLRHLLMMSSGIDFVEDYEARGSDMRKLFFDVFILNADIDRFVENYQRNRQAGSDFEYISPNSHVLAAVLRGAYGKPVPQIASEKLFQPLGMADATWLTDRNAVDGKAVGYCCLQTRASDYARFGQLYVQDGMWDGQRLLPVGWTDLVSTPPSPMHVPGKTMYGTRGYGLHFWIPPDPEEEFFANGYNGQTVWIDRPRGVVVVQTAADEDSVARIDETMAVMRMLAREAG